MCGLFGYLTSRREGMTIDLAAALESIRHRGPDAQKTARFEGQHWSVGLAHARLAIIDLSRAADQPMLSRDGKHAIVFNGEVFNFRELRTQLEALGNNFVSDSDTEVVLASYKTWGSDCVNRFRGFFAFAIISLGSGDVFLARDRLGIKPLYLARLPGGFAFSSQVRALLASGAVPRTLSARGLQSYLCFGAVAEPECIVANVVPVEPGTYVELSGGSCRTTKYWNLSGQHRSHLSGKEALPQLSAELKTAVALRLISDVPLGVFLSGGIDSTAITSLAASTVSRPLHTFTIAFDQNRYSEQEPAERVAMHYRCNHSTLVLRGDIVRTHVSEALNAQDQPSVDGVNTYFVAQAARRAGIKVALSGLGGDEVFAGYPLFRLIRNIRRISRIATRAEVRWATRMIEARLPYRLSKAWRICHTGTDLRRLYAIGRELFAPYDRRRLIRDEYMVADASDFVASAPEVEENADLGLIGRLSILELTNYLRNTLLRDSDCMSMAHGLELRVPLLDHVVLESAVFAPDSMKVSTAVNKPLLVAAAGGNLPSVATHRRKMGFCLPFEHWMRNELSTWVQARLASRNSGLWEFLSPDGAQWVWSTFNEKSETISWSRVWALLALIQWCDTNAISGIN